jgi:hypothetical protein
MKLRLALVAAAAAWASLPAGEAQAQAVISSPAPESVDVTVYRDPSRSASRAMELEWLGGYALISETRRIDLPAGESEIRFEGVAGGILPQSAIVTGFPEGIVERNRDAYLLSPATLLDRSLGRRVHLRRTSLATGAVREQDAVIRSGAGGAVVLQTAEGIEALRCTGVPETLIYDSIPDGLSARPTLSVRARSRVPVAATVTLSYLATGFDWQANYIGTLSPDGDRLDLFAWLTLANGDETGFANADTQAVAGRLNREQVEPQRREGGPLELRCWPQATTSDIAAPELVVQARRARMGGTRREDLVAADADEMSVMVTGSRIPTPEALGDLKLYRIPEPVTVAANSQKQVALLQQPDVEVGLVYRLQLDPDGSRSPEPANLFLVTRNRTAEGLGLPLPAGGFTLFTPRAGRPILIGEGSIDDSAVGEDVEIRIAEATGVMTEVEAVDDGKDWEDFVLTVTNDRPTPVRFEAEFRVDEEVEFRPGRRLARRDGRPLWAVRVPANGTATLRYRVVVRDDD